MAAPPPPTPSTPLLPSDYFQLGALGVGAILGGTGVAGLLSTNTLAVLASAVAVLTTIGSYLHQRGH
jgi:hypothetical protein